jgi:hypothetical protein
MDKPNHHFYVFECDYAMRTKEVAFTKGILDSFDKDTATMVALIVNNNIYKLEFHIGVAIEGDPTRFEAWLRSEHPHKMRRHNLFLHELTRHGNVVTLIDSEMVDTFLTSKANFPFLFPERAAFEEEHPQFKPARSSSARVFLSHSSRDKERIVLPLYSYLQSESIPVWLDSFEIDYGENIYLKVSEAIEQCEIGLFVLTDNFFDPASGWPVAEFSSFFGDMMKRKKKILMLNAGVEHASIHALMRPYKYIDWNEGKGLAEIAKAIRSAADKYLNESA